MPDGWSLRLATALLRLGTRGGARALREACLDPAAAQAVVLRRMLAGAVGSRYGQAHGFADIATPEAYQARVPVVDGDGLRPWVEAIAAGESNVLTGEPVLMMERTSGSAQAAKLVPYTASLRAEFQAATSAWLHDLYAQRPALRGRTAYWSISPLGRLPERTAGGLPIGFEDDTAYFEPAERWVLDRLMAAPAALREAPDLATCRYVTWRHLLQGGGPALASVWHPSFLTLLLEAARAEADRLLYDLRHGTLNPPEPLPPGLHARLGRGLIAEPARARALAARLRDGPWRGSDLLPDLALISCWTEGAAARALPALQAHFPGVEVQGKGLLATEGVVSVPLLGHPGAVPALTSHFFEFLPSAEAGTRPRLVHELEEGGRYEVLLTTGGGLYRYALRDVVEVVGRLGRTPLLVFRGRAGLVSDLVGEKLTAVFVEAVLERVLTAHALGGRFAMLAPASGGEPPGYELCVAAELGPGEREHLRLALEQGLRENPHYAYARELGQLDAVRVVPVGADAEARYLAACVALGQRAGDVKPTPLHRQAGWRERLVGPVAP